MKPFYFSLDGKNEDDRRSFVAVVFESVHEKGDYMVVLIEEKTKTDYSRITANSPNEAAEKSFDRFVKMEKYKRSTE
jgi:hypothetical protein